MERGFLFLVFASHIKINFGQLRDGVHHEDNTGVCRIVDKIPFAQSVPYLGVNHGDEATRFDPQIRISYKVENLQILKTIETCCPGYELIEGDICMPVCDPLCENGECVLPQTCKCREGYLLSGSSHNICRPKCNPACINGACVSPPNVCVCKKGYSFVPNSKSICHPVCTHQCLNGRCVGPDKCECINDQYEFEDKFRCKPKCSQNCLNGVCVSPNVCKCFPNFDYNRYTGNCMPSRCTRCFGECVAPGLCRCDEKSYFNIFEIVGSTNCEPSCPENCKLSGGYCREVNMCSCPDDFFLGGAVDGWCYPLCKQNCSNGQCIEPNAPDCICPKGLAKDTTGVCRAECVKCGKVKCSPPGICDCNRGTVFDRETKSCRLTCKLCQDDKCSHPPFCCKEELEKYKNGTCVLIPMVVDVQD